jgi:hypothetical protein
MLVISSCNFTASLGDCIALKTLISSANIATRLMSLVTLAGCSKVG